MAWLHGVGATLALTGRYDVASPGTNRDEPGRRLPNGTLFDVGDAGHGSRNTPCSADTIRAFLESPESPRWPTCLDQVQTATFRVE